MQGVRCALALSLSFVWGCVCLSDQSDSSSWWTSRPSSSTDARPLDVYKYSHRSPRWRADAWAATTPDTEEAGLTSTYPGMCWARPFSVEAQHRGDSPTPLKPEQSHICLTLWLRSAFEEPSPVVRSSLSPLVLCNRKTAPRKPPWVISGPPSEIGQTVTVPLFQQNLKSGKKYLETTQGEIMQINQTNYPPSQLITVLHNTIIPVICENKSK